MTFFDQVFLACIALVATCAFGGAKLMQPVPKSWAKYAFSAAIIFACVALARLLYLNAWYPSPYFWMYGLGMAGIALLGLQWGQWSIPARAATNVDAPVYWTLTESLSWIAFGEAVTTQHWSALSRRIAIGLMEERHRFYTAQRLLFEKLRNPDSRIDIQGKEAGEGVHKTIPSNVFLSDIGASILDDSLGMPNEADIGKILNWDGPKWTDVRLRRAHILENWKSRANISTVADDLGRLILRTRPIMDQLQDHDSMPPTGPMQEWRSDAIDYIRSNMGRAYEARFTQPRTFSDEELGPLGRNPVNVLKVGLQHRISLLHQFIEEARA